MDLPSAFGPLGIPGIAAADKISTHKTIAAIPTKLMISTQMVKEGELKNLIEENPDFFQTKGNATDQDYLIISLFILFEKMKGEKSFWKPYLDLIDK